MQLKSRFPSSLSSVVQVEHIYVVKYYGTYTGVGFMCVSKKSQNKTALKQRLWGNVLSSR